MRKTIKQCTALGLSSLAGLLCAVSLSAAAPTTPQGLITTKIFKDIGGGTTVADLTGNAKFPDSPDEVTYSKYFELYAGDDINTPPAGDVMNNSGAQIIGFFYPDATADYTFYVCADDGANLYLSTDDTAANKKLIAQETGWSGVRNYTGVGGGSTVEAKNSSTFTGTQWPTKVGGLAKITLTKGKAYYIEALMKEGGGGEDLSVSIDGTLPIPGSMLSSDRGSGPATIVTQPASVTVNEGAPATFSVVVSGTPPYTFRWLKNGAEVSTGSDKYQIARTVRADNGAKFKVEVTGAQGAMVTSSEATLTLNLDTVAPTITAIKASMDFLTATVTLSEPLDQASAESAGNYKFSNGLTVSSAKLAGASGTANDNKVILTTSKQGEGQEYTLTVNGVKDAAGNAIAANSTILFKSALFAKGWGSFQRWYNENGDPGDLNAFSTAFNDGTIRAPDFDTAVSFFGEPWGQRDNYSARVYGYFIPPSNGNYVFFVSSDDGSMLYLSTDDKPANKKLIARETAWSNQYQFTASGGNSDLASKRSDQCPENEWGTITLKANTRYYMEVLHDEGGGGDGVDVTFIKEGDADPSNDAAGMKMKGDVIGTFLDPNGATLTIDQEPADATQQELRTAKFTVAATGNTPYGNTVTYQWQKAPSGSSTFTDIAGATAASYTTPLLALADNGTQYKVVCSVPTLSKVSAAAKLTVVADTFAPKLEAAGAIGKGTGIEVGVRFDENVDPTTAGATANYTLSKGTVTGVRYQKFNHTGTEGFFQLGSTGPHYGGAVVLTTTGLAGGDTVTITVKNVKDLKGNAMSAAGESTQFIVTKKMKWVGMGGDDYLQGELGGQEINTEPSLWPDDVAAYSDADFDLISGGTANWNNYDEATFVYEEVTGDFDKVVRCEYQDPTSQWARHGMCATPNADEGVTRAQVTGGATMEKRYMLRCNPPVQWNGAAGNNQNEADWRDTAGGNYGGTGAGNPAYPNAWLRMQRIGQTFTGFYSSDGKNWTSYGAHTFTEAEPMPAKLLVGIYYTPEFGNNGAGAGVGHSAVAKFRQYGNYVAKPSEVTYGVGLNFGADEPNGAMGGILPTIGTAGVPGVVQGNWNNLTNATGSSTTIVADKLGTAAPTSVSVTWSCPNTWASTGRGEENNKLTGNDKILMTGYLDTGNATTTTIEITGLPTDLTSKGYDVYVYALGGVSARGGGYAITDASDALLTDWVDAQSPANPTNYVQAVPAAGTWAVGNYIVFKNLKANSIKVLASTENGHGFSGTPRAGVNAIQLVPTGGGGGTPPGKMTIALAAGSVTINWEGSGMLQSAATVSGPWTDVGTAKPYTTPATGTMYYRVKGQ